MIILFGFRRKSSRLATIFVMCAHCHTPAAHALTRSRRFFTLFFIPVIPLGTKYFTTCTMCGHVTQITKEGADQYLASVAQASGAQPSGTPSGPAGSLAPGDGGGAAPVPPLAQEGIDS
jgi:zinc ribbon protein